MSFLKKERHGHVLVLTMSSPETRNALTSDEQFADIETTCAEVNDDMSVRAVVLTGEGSAFCAGGNVKDMRDRQGLFSGDPFDQADAYRKGLRFDDLVTHFGGREIRTVNQFKNVLHTKVLL